MVCNTEPIFPKQPAMGWGTVTTANTAKDGTGTVVTVFTAGTDGSRADRLRIRHMGSNVATVLRVFINNGSTNATATNNSLWSEITVGANTNSEVAASTEYEIPLDLPLKNGYKINITIGTTIASGLAVTVDGGDY